MRLLPKTLVTSAAAVLILAFSLGQAAQPDPTPRALAVININKVFGALNEKIDGDAEIEGMASKIKADQQKREEELERLANQLKDNLFNPDSPEYQKMQDDALEKRAEYDSF